MYSKLKKYYKENPFRFAINLGCFVYLFLALSSYIFDYKSLNELGKQLFIIIVLVITLFEDLKDTVKFWKDSNKKEKRK